MRKLLSVSQLEALAKAAEEDLAKGKAEGADAPSIRPFEDFKKKMRRRGDSDKKRAEKLAQRRARSAGQSRPFLLALSRMPSCMPLQQLSWACLWWAFITMGLPYASYSASERASLIRIWLWLAANYSWGLTGDLGYLQDCAQLCGAYAGQKRLCKRRRLKAESSLSIQMGTPSQAAALQMLGTTAAMEKPIRNTQG